MQKTQVIKLNTSKDNVESFFNKVKDKLSKKGEQIENYDITMIVKRQSNQNNNQLTKQNVNESFLNPKQQPTLKSIFSQNTAGNAKQSKQQKENVRNQIYDEDMRIQTNILGRQQAQSKQKQIKNQVNSNSSSKNKNKVSKSNMMPNESALFKFKKKQESQKTQKSQITQKNQKAFKSQGIKQREQKSTKQNNNYFPNLQKPKQHHKSIQQQSKQQQQESLSQKSQISSHNQSSSQSRKSQSSQQQNSQIQQVRQQQLKRHISHRHIDIFPNIELNNVVSEKLMSLKTLNNQVAKKKQVNTQRRRCSINDENLLSPRMQSIFNQEIKHQSTKDINNLLMKDKLSKQNSTIKSQIQFDIDDGIKEDDMDEKEVKVSRKQRKSNTSIRAFQDQRSQLFQTLTRPQVRYKSRQRTSALAKKSIFQQQQQQQSSKNKKQIPKQSKNKIQFNQQNHSNQFVITVPQQPSHTYISSNNNNNSQNIQSDQDQQSQQSSSSNQQPQDSIYTIENKLNDCIQLIEKNQIFKLEDFLYEFKNKYNYVTNTKILIKWRLMMAHCKESKKEFERAAINYNSVIEMAKDNPKSLTIEPAQVYHRLGVCYSEIGQYNKGILAFTQALNRYKRAKIPLKYAQCINNLGTLYLQAESLNLAQKCFLQSYHLKKSLFDKNNTKLLTSLFNIFQCNLLMKNYDQAEKIILVIEDQIIKNIPQDQINRLLYLGGLYRRKGKMEFLRGNLKQAEQNYLKSFENLSNRYPYCMQFGQLMSCMGILKLQDRKYRQAKQYYDKAIMLMNFYCPKDSTTIHTLKKNLEYAVKMIAQERNGSASRNSFFD